MVSSSVAPHVAAVVEAEVEDCDGEIVESNFEQNILSYPTNLSRNKPQI